MIKVYDDFLSPEEQQDVIDYCECASYNYGESDDGDTPPTGVTHNIPKNDSIYRLFEDRLKPVAPKGSDLYLSLIHI